MLSVSKQLGPELGVDVTAPVDSFSGSNRPSLALTASPPLRGIPCISEFTKFLTDPVAAASLSHQEIFV